MKKKKKKIAEVVSIALRSRNMKKTKYKTFLVTHGKHCQTSQTLSFILNV